MHTYRSYSEVCHVEQSLRLGAATGSLQHGSYSHSPPIAPSKAQLVIYTFPFCLTLSTKLAAYVGLTSSNCFQDALRIRFFECPIDFPTFLYPATIETSSIQPNISRPIIFKLLVFRRHQFDPVICAGVLCISDLKHHPQSHLSKPQRAKLSQFYVTTS